MLKIDKNRDWSYVVILSLSPSPVQTCAKILSSVSQPLGQSSSKSRLFTQIVEDTRYNFCPEIFKQKWFLWFQRLKKPCRYVMEINIKHISIYIWTYRYIKLDIHFILGIYTHTVRESAIAVLVSESNSVCVCFHLIFPDVFQVNHPFEHKSDHLQIQIHNGHLNMFMPFQKLPLFFKCTIIINWKYFKWALKIYNK